MVEILTLLLFLTVLSSRGIYELISPKKKEAENTNTIAHKNNMTRQCLFGVLVKENIKYIHQC